MPVRVELDNRSGGLVATVEATSATVDLLRETTRQVWATEGFGACYLVWDVRGVQLQMSADEVRELANFAAENSPLKAGARMAIVHDQPVEFGLARMLAAHRGSGAVEVFASRQLDEALDWARQAPAARAHAAAQDDD